MNHKPAIYYTKNTFTKVTIQNVLWSGFVQVGKTRIKFGSTPLANMLMSQFKSIPKFMMPNVRVSSIKFVLGK